jgi:hypothetical protein
MGINAQTSVPKFTAGDTLTAANTNLLANGIGVFAGTATRDASFGGSGEKVLAEGQFAYLEDTNTTQFYDGAAWQPVGTTPALVYITQATPTAVNSVSINNCFTSTYANYLIVIDTSAAVGNGSITARLRVSGTDATTNYTSQRFLAYGISYEASTNPSGTDDFYFGAVEATFGATSASTTTLYSPALARGTVATTITGYNASIGTSMQTIWNNHTTATAYDGITFNFSGTSFTGTIRIYGYQNS